MEKLEDLNAICMECQAKSRKNFEIVDPRACRYCPIGQKIHKLEVKSGSEWTKVDWNSSQMKKYYHG